MRNRKFLIRRIVSTAIVGYLALLLAVVVLARLGAGTGWYYGLCIAATSAITYRILVPALGVPSERLHELRRRRRERRLPRPIH
jgi:hypothetical protein